QGRTVDFRNTVVIMTSNLGSQFFREEKDPARVRGLILHLLTQTLRPEFLNSIDETVIFQPLGREEIASIVEIQARHLVKRLADRRITLDLTTKARELLAREGYDPVYGARPLTRRATASSSGRPRGGAGRRLRRRPGSRSPRGRDRPPRRA